MDARTSPMWPGHRARKTSRIRSLRQGPERARLRPKLSLQLLGLRGEGRLGEPMVTQKGSSVDLPEDRCPALKQVMRQALAPTTHCLAGPFWKPSGLVP